MTATQLIYKALRAIGCLRSGQTTSTDINNDALDVLNDMIDSWLLDELMVFAARPDIYNLTAGLQTYTIGPAGASFTAARPTQIVDANIIINTVTPVIRKPLSLLNPDQWAAIAVQAIPFALPLALWYDRGFSSVGAGTLRLWPGPLASYQLELFTWQQLTKFADLVTDYKFPPGYTEAMSWNLALNLAPSMKVHQKIAQPLLEAVAAKAVTSRAEVQSYNAPDPVLTTDGAFMGDGVGAWSYLTGSNSGRRA